MANKTIVYSADPYYVLHDKGSGAPAPSLPAWAAASSEYMVTGSGSHEFLAQLIGEGTPTFDTPAGLLLPDYEGVYHEIPEDTMPVYGSRVVTNYVLNSDDMTAGTPGSANVPGWNTLGNAVITGADTATIGPDSNSDELRVFADAQPLFESVVTFSIMMSGPVGQTIKIIQGSVGSGGAQTFGPFLLTGELQLFSFNRQYTVDVPSETPFIYVRSQSGTMDIVVKYVQMEINTKDGIPASQVTTLSDPVTKYYTNINGNTLTPENNGFVVTEAEGAPLTTMPSLYAAPEATNLIEWSRDLTQAGWIGSASLDTTYDQVGITGEPNTATLITPASSGSNRVRTQIKTISAGSAVQRVIVKWDSGVSNWAALSVVGLDTTPLKVWYDVVTGVVGTVDGAVAADIEALGGGWYACYLETASTTLLDGQWSVSPTNNDGVDGGAVGEGRIIGNFEVYSGKTIDQVRGSAPIVTAGASVTNALVTDLFDSLNMSDTQGAIYIEAKMPLANNVLSTFIETVGANYRVNDGTTTATQPWTADTWQKVGIAYGSSQMSINVDGVWSADVAYDGTLLSGALDLFRAPAGADTGRNIQRWDLDYAAAQAKIAELMT